MTPLTESAIEEFAIKVRKTLGWQHVHGLSIVPGAEYAERDSFEQIILTQPLRKAVARLNRDIPADAQEQTVQKVLRIYSSDMLHINETRTLHRLRDTLIPKMMNGV